MNLSLYNFLNISYIRTIMKYWLKHYLLNTDYNIVRLLLTHVSREIVNGTSYNLGFNWYRSKSASHLHLHDSSFSLLPVNIRHLLKKAMQSFSF